MLTLSLVLLVFLGCGGAAYGALDARARRDRFRARLDRMTRPPGAPPAEADAEREPPPVADWEARLGRALTRSGLPVGPRAFAGLCVAGPALLGMCGALLTRLPLMALLLALIGAAVPWLVLRRGEDGRRARFNGQLPDTLALFVSALRAGYSLARAVQMAAEELPAPVSEECAQALGELALGLPLSEALAHVAARVGSQDWDLVVTAITTQQQTGGNLAEILSRIADTIRERVRVQGEIGTLTAEGRLSGLILTLLPPTLALLLTLRDPHYFQPLWDAPIGHVLIGGAVVGQVIGAVILRRMVALDV